VDRWFFFLSLCVSRPFFSSDYKSEEIRGIRLSASQGIHSFVAYIKKAEEAVRMEAVDMRS
jgi:hypothetical protein